MKKTYQPPILKVVEFKVERGFEGSRQPITQIELDDPQATETFTSNTNWGTF